VSDVIPNQLVNIKHIIKVTAFRYASVARFELATKDLWVPLFDVLPRIYITADLRSANPPTG
jgi:hypothetical protein